MSPTDSPYVSVVVATYESDPDALDRLVRSLDDQTLPAADFEVIFVDDGSTGRTWSDLERIRAARPGVRIVQIDHSGWPSRPRNVGIDLARGEYVMFVDHDDELMPQALEHAHAFAVRHDLDVVNLKTIKTSQPGYGFTAYDRDRAGDKLDLGVLTLVPMMPHKLYRRRMLRERDVRFVEGARVIWEDIYFNIDAYAAADRIGTLASTAAYRHVVGAANASHSYLPDRAEYWSTVLAVLHHVGRALPGPDYAVDRQVLYDHQYRDRVLQRVVTLLAADATDAFAVALPVIREIQQTWVPPGRSDTWSARDRRIDQLLRQDDPAELVELCRGLSPVLGVSRTTDLAWRGSSLTATATASWSRPPSAVTPGLLGATSPAEEAALQAEVERSESCLVLRARSTLETTVVSTASTVGEADVADPLSTLEVVASGLIDPAQLAGPEVYDVFVRNAALGFANTRGLRTDARPQVGLLDGRAVIAYRTTAGMLAVDMDQQARSIINSCRRDYDALVGQRGPLGGFELSLPLRGVRVRGRTRIEGRVEFVPAGSRPRPGRHGRATLVGDELGARVEVSGRLLPGDYGLAFAFDEGAPRASNIRLHLPVGARSASVTAA